MGTTFAEHLVEYMKSKGEILEEAKTIARNPQQSKHLETAMVRIRGLELDLVNLRNEVYAENTRIPTEVVSRTRAYMCTGRPTSFLLSRPSELRWKTHPAVTLRLTLYSIIFIIAQWRILLARCG